MSQRHGGRGGRVIRAPRSESPLITLLALAKSLSSACTLCRSPDSSGGGHPRAVREEADPGAGVSRVSRPPPPLKPPSHPRTGAVLPQLVREPVVLRPELQQLRLGEGIRGFKRDRPRPGGRNSAAPPPGPASPASAGTPRPTGPAPSWRRGRTPRGGAGSGRSSLTRNGGVEKRKRCHSAAIELGEEVNPMGRGDPAGTIEKTVPARLAVPGPPRRRRPL